MTAMKRTLVVLAVLAALAGCGGSTKPSATKAAAVTSTATTPSTDSVQAVASAVDQAKAPLLESRSKIKDSCPAFDSIGGYTCELLAEAARIQADTASKSLDALRAPAQVRDLLNGTTSALYKVQTASLSGCKAHPGGGTCQANVTLILFALNDLSDQLAGWTPYGG